MFKNPLKKLSLAAMCAAGLVSGVASANTINQNVSWTITRSGATTTYRVVAYGDSIYAGYNGALWSVAKRSAPHVQGEYLGKQWNANVQVVRRTKSGAVASDIYNNKIVYERSYMQATNTRVVTFEMCGNDFLQARSAFNDQTGTCNYGVLDTALSNCTLYTEKAMQAINTYATTAKLKLVSNIYYPGYNADNVQTACKDSVTGATVNKRDKFIPYLAKANWRTCNLAARYGFQCVDSFAQWMGSDYDRNGDGVVDSEALRYQAGETEADYVTRITSTLKSTIVDSNTHFVSSTTSYDYLQSDNTHGTYYGGTVSTGSSYSGAADFADSSVVDGKNTVWNRTGHERMGHGAAVFNPATP